MTTTSPPTWSATSTPCSWGTTPSTGSTRWWPDGDLVGRQVADLDVGSPSESSLVVDGGVDELEAYDATTSIVPVRISGEVQDGTDGELTVAIAVDGVIAAVVPTYPDGDVAQRVDAILDPSALGPTAPHEVEAFLVTGRGTARRLLPLG